MEELEKRVEGAVDEKWQCIKNEEIIESNQDFFNFYIHLPKVVTTILACLFALLSILDPALIQVRYGYFTSYGIMGMSSFVLAMIVWWFIAIPICIFYYFCLKISLSHKILQIYYLKSINEKLTDKNQR